MPARPSLSITASPSGMRTLANRVASAASPDFTGSMACDVASTGTRGSPGYPTHLKCFEVKSCWKLKKDPGAGISGPNAGLNWHCDAEPVDYFSKGSSTYFRSDRGTIKLWCPIAEPKRATGWQKATYPIWETYQWVWATFDYDANVWRVLYAYDDIVRFRLLEDAKACKGARAQIVGYKCNRRGTEYSCGTAGSDSSAQSSTATSGSGSESGSIGSGSSLGSSSSTSVSSDTSESGSGSGSESIWSSNSQVSSLSKNCGSSTSHPINSDSGCSHGFAHAIYSGRMQFVESLPTVNDAGVTLNAPYTTAMSVEEPASTTRTIIKVWDSLALSTQVAPKNGKVAAGTYGWAKRCSDTSHFEVMVFAECCNAESSSSQSSGGTPSSLIFSQSSVDSGSGSSSESISSSSAPSSSSITSQSSTSGASEGSANESTTSTNSTTSNTSKGSGDHESLVSTSFSTTSSTVYGSSSSQPSSGSSLSSASSLSYPSESVSSTSSDSSSSESSVSASKSSYTGSGSASMVSTSKSSSSQPSSSQPSKSSVSIPSASSVSVPSVSTSRSGPAGCESGFAIPFTRRFGEGGCGTTDCAWIATYNNTTVQWEWDRAYRNCTSICDCGEPAMNPGPSVGTQHTPCTLINPPSSDGSSVASGCNQALCGAGYATWTWVGTDGNGHWELTAQNCDIVTQGCSPNAPNRCGTYNGETIGPGCTCGAAGTPVNCESTSSSTSSMSESLSSSVDESSVDCEGHMTYQFYEGGWNLVGWVGCMGDTCGCCPPTCYGEESEIYQCDCHAGWDTMQCYPAHPCDSSGSSSSIVSSSTPSSSSTHSSSSCDCNPGPTINFTWDCRTATWTQVPGQTVPECCMICPPDFCGTEQGEMGQGDGRPGWADPCDFAYLSCETCSYSSSSQADSSQPDSSQPDNSSVSSESVPSANEGSSSSQLSSSSSQPSSGSSSGPSKSCIVATSSGYRRMYCDESDDVGFNRTIKIPLTGNLTILPIHPIYEEICEKGSITITSAFPNRAAMMGGEVIGREVHLYMEGSATSAVLSLRGIRKGFAGISWEPASEEEFLSNSAAWRSLNQ